MCDCNCYQDAATPTAQAAVPSINVMFETHDPSVPVTGTKSAVVKRVERQDDGSFTAFIDHWPTPTAQRGSSRGYGMPTGAGRNPDCAPNGVRSRDRYDAILETVDRAHTDPCIGSLKSDVDPAPMTADQRRNSLAALRAEIERLKDANEALTYKLVDAEAEIERMTKERDFLIQAAKDVGASFRKAMYRAEKAEAEAERGANAVADAFNIIFRLHASDEAMTREKAFWGK